MWLPVWRIQPSVISLRSESGSQPVAAFPVSARLAKLFDYLGVRVLGDLQGRNFVELATYRNVGRHTVWELLQLVSPFLDPSALAGVRPARKHCTAVVVPEAARDLSLFDFPLSSSLARSLQRLGLTCWREVEAIPVSRLLATPGISTKRVWELETLAARLVAGEFELPDGTGENHVLPDLARGIDELLPRLSDFEQRLWRGRFGADGQPPLTFRQLESRLGFSAPRLSYELYKSFVHAHDLGAPRLGFLLKRAVLLCTEAGSLFTPQLLAQELNQASRQAQFPLPFYVRLLGAWNPELPVWLEPNSLCGGRIRYQRALEECLRTILKGAGAPLPLREAYETITGAAPYRRMRFCDFVAALKMSDSLVVSFLTPECPMVAAHPRRQPRRKRKRVAR